MRLAAFIAAMALWTGCSPRHETQLGAVFQGQRMTVAEIQKAALESSVVLTGTMTRKCPVAGCWFVLHDQTGDIHVDTKDAGFVVVDVPVNSQLTVAGRITSKGSSSAIDATALRY